MGVKDVEPRESNYGQSQLLSIFHFQGNLALILDELIGEYDVTFVKRDSCEFSKEDVFFMMSVTS